MGNYYAYLRISTDTERQSFNRQYKALENYKEKHFPDDIWVGVYKEEKSAKNFEERKEYQKLRKAVHEGDTIVFKDLSRFTREAEKGYEEYMWLVFDKKVNLVFIDNPTISSDYIKQLINTAEEQDIITKTAMEMVVKLLLIVELDRAEKHREYISKAITDGIKASSKKSGRKKGQLDKMTAPLQFDIKCYLNKTHGYTQEYLMKKWNIKSKTTMRKYIAIVKAKEERVGL